MAFQTGIRRFFLWPPMLQLDGDVVETESLQLYIRNAHRLRNKRIYTYKTYIIIYNTLDVGI